MPTTVLESVPKSKPSQSAAAATQNQLESLINTDAQCGMQTYGRLQVAFARGAGTLLWDVEGKEYLDFLAGIAVVPLGHCHPRVAAAVAQQASTLLHTSNLYYIEPQVKLAQRLHQLSGGMRAFFCNSGAEANEAALKLARKYAKQQRGQECYEIITAVNSFHGRTYGSLAATGQPKYHEGFAPMPTGFRYVPLNDIQQLQDAINDHTAAIMLEPIQGEGGIRPCTPEFLQAARDLCNRHGLVLIFDEVQTGMGRTGRFFAHEWAGVRPDIITMAKGLGNGVPIGALLATEPLARAFVPGDHGCTFGGNFLSCAAALATLDVLFDEHLVENADKMGAYFQERIKEWGAQTGLVKEVRGYGLMIGVDLTRPIARDLMKAALQNGLIFNAVGDTTLRFLPPLCITQEDVETAMARLNEAYKVVAA